MSSFLNSLPALAKDQLAKLPLENCTATAVGSIRETTNLLSDRLPAMGKTALENLPMDKLAVVKDHIPATFKMQPDNLLVENIAVLAKQLPGMITSHIPVGNLTALWTELEGNYPQVFEVISKASDTIGDFAVDHPWIAGTASFAIGVAQFVGAGPVFQLFGFGQRGPNAGEFGCRLPAKGT